MFRPKEMKKVRVIVLKSQVENLVRELHEAGLVDIRKSAHEGLSEGRPLSSFDSISAELLKLRTLLTLMEPSAGKKEAGKVIDGKTAMKESRNLAIDEKVRSLNQRITELGDKIKASESSRITLQKLSGMNVDFSKLRTRSLDFRLGELSVAKTANLKKDLEKYGSLVSKGQIALVLYEKKHQQQVDSLLGDAGFADLELPDGMTTPAATLSLIEKASKDASEQMAREKKELAEISKANISKIRSLISSLEVEAERAEISSRFSESNRMYVVEGWIIASDYDKLEPISKKHHAMLESVHFGHHETAPTVLDNPGVIKPFEFITKSYSYPKYHEIDPTVPYFLFLSIIYGMIIGDVIYGLTSMAVAYLIVKKFSKSEMMASVGMIWLISGIPTVIFGLIFDEWAGLSHFTLANYIGSWAGVQLLSAPIYTGFHRVESLSMLLLITLFVGMLHLAVGLVLGVVNEWNHSKKHALAKVCWLAFEIGVAVALLSQLGYVGKSFTTVGLVIIGVGALGIIVMEGAAGAVELPGFAGNILSYLRIGVIGVVGVILAEILNEFLKPNPSMGIMALVLLPIYLLLHLVNCVIAMFEALVQGGRLNIFEFKTKFLHGGGSSFTPFALYSKEI